MYMVRRVAYVHPFRVWVSGELPLMILQETSYLEESLFFMVVTSLYVTQPK